MKWNMKPAVGKNASEDNGLLRFHDFYVSTLGSQGKKYVRTRNCEQCADAQPTNGNWGTGNKESCIGVRNFSTADSLQRLIQLHSTTE
jgi:hypothetical protein